MYKLKEIEAALELLDKYEVSRVTSYERQKETMCEAIMKKPNKTKEELKAEIEELKKEHAKLEIENKVLKKANEILKKEQALIILC